MAYEPKEGYGSFFLQTKKTNPAQPDYQGEILLDGKLWKLGIWKKKGTTNGINWELLSAKVDSNQASNARPTKREVNGFNDMDSDVPF